MAFYVGQTNLGPNFYPKLVQISKELGMKPEDLLAVMTSESGIQNNIGEDKFRGGGLIGFMPDTQKMLGFKGSPEDFLKLSGEQQLDYVKRFMRDKIAYNDGQPIASATQAYISIFFPAALKLPGIKRQDPNAIFIEKNPETVKDPKTGQAISKKYWDVGVKVLADHEKSAYKHNPLFYTDKGKDVSRIPGAITYGDMERQTNINKKMQTYRSAVKTMAAQTGYQTTGSDEQSPDTITGSTLFAGDSITVPLERFVAVSGNKGTIAGVGKRASWLLEQLQKAAENGQLKEYKNAVVLIGTNDLPGGQSAEEIFSTIKKIWSLLKSQGLHITAATIPPLKNWKLWTPEWEKKRKQINNEIIASGGYDGIVRLDELLADKSDPSKLAAEFDSGDGLHPRANKLGPLYTKEVGRLSTKKPEYQTQMGPSKSTGILGMTLDFFAGKFITWLEGLMGSTAASNTSNLIIITGDDTNTKLEYAQVLQSVLKEELNCGAKIHYNGDNVELVANGANKEKLKDICLATSKAFRDATKKLGGLEVYGSVIGDEGSKYQEVDIDIAELNRRMFKLKYARGKQ